MVDEKGVNVIVMMYDVCSDGWDLLWLIECVLVDVLVGVVMWCVS